MKFGVLVAALANLFLSSHSVTAFFVGEADDAVLSREEGSSAGGVHRIPYSKEVLVLATLSNLAGHCDGGNGSWLMLPGVIRDTFVSVRGDCECGR